jgi:hypothetical protein
MTNKNDDRKRFIGQKSRPSHRDDETKPKGSKS